MQGHLVAWKAHEAARAAHTHPLDAPRQLEDHARVDFDGDDLLRQGSATCASSDAKKVHGTRVHSPA